MWALLAKTKSLRQKQNKNNENNINKMLEDVQAILQRQQRIMNQQLNKMNRLNSNNMLNDYNTKPPNSIEVQQMYNKQQIILMADSYSSFQNKNNSILYGKEMEEEGDKYDIGIIKNKQDSYGLNANDINSNIGNGIESSVGASGSQSVIDSFDNLDDNKEKAIITNKNLQIESTEYNHQNWYNIFGKIVIGELK